MPSVFRRVALAVGAALVLSLGAAPAAQRSSAPSAPAPPAQKQDADFAAQVKTWTTKPEFLTPLVDHLPVVPGVPSPKDVLGYHVGIPGRLTSTADALRYYRCLLYTSDAADE